MYIFFVKGVRSGVSYISNRYSKAIKNYWKSYDLKQESNHNLYDYAMSKFLPTSNFKWLDPKEFELNKYTSNSLKGCALEVDLDYPKELHELHNDYPLAPNRIEIKRKMLSDYQLEVADLYNILIGVVCCPMLKN